MNSTVCKITPLVLEHTLTVLSPPGRIRCIYAVRANHYNAAFFFPPGTFYFGTAGWTEAAWNEKFIWGFYTRPAVGIKAQTFWSLVQCPIHSATHLERIILYIAFLYRFKANIMLPKSIFTLRKKVNIHHAGHLKNGLFPGPNHW